MKKIIFQKFVEENIMGVDKIVRHKDGTFSLKKGFFYRHGMDSDKWANILSERLSKANVNFNIVESFEDWNAWPKDSWFVVKIEVLNY